MTNINKESLQKTPYLAIELKDEDASGTILQALSPIIMRWDQSIWLVDLSSCASYWSQGAERNHLSITIFLKKILHDLYGDSFRATLARHPWQAVLILNEMKQRQLPGFLVISSPFGQSLLQDLSWDSWWECIDSLIPNLTQANRRRWNPAVFKRQCRDLKRIAKRLGLASAGHLQSMPTAGIIRRFGATLGELRDWTYEAPNSAKKIKDHGNMTLLFEEKDAFSSGFPWHSLRHTKQPTIARHLDTPLREWAHIEPLLREDFDRLCLLDTWAQGERIVSLEWRLTLSDLTPLTLLLRFRYPHALHSEQGLQKTALLQASYSFENVKKTRRKSSSLKDGYEWIPGMFAITNWELCITERLTTPCHMTSLFDDHMSERDEESHATSMPLLQLENKLSIPLISFALCSDLIPENSFMDCAQIKNITPVKQDNITRNAHSLASSALSIHWPLFIYQQPQPIDRKLIPNKVHFKERTMQKWWDSSLSKSASTSGKSLQRDYYRIKDTEKRCLWIYRDSLGQYFVHGIYQ